MKKILLLIITAGFAFSCSDDFPDPVVENPLTAPTLVKKVVRTAADGTEFTSLYTYSGNKITVITHNDGTIENYAYQGDYLTEIRHYKDGGLVRKETFLYDSNGVFGAHVDYNYDLANPSNSYALRTDYSYNGNKVNFVQYTGDESSQTNAYQTGTITLTGNGNIVKYESSLGNTIIDYSFDYKNAPLKEAQSYAILLLTQFEGGYNNVTSSAISANGATSTTLTNYTYNDKDYPATAVYTAADSSIYNIQYFY